MAQSKAWSIPVDWKTAINKSGFGLTSVLEMKASFSMLHVQGAALGLGFMAGFYPMLWFLWLPQSLGVCPQPLVLICLARMSAGGRVRMQCPANWDCGFPFSLEWEAGQKGEHGSAKVQDCTGCILGAGGANKQGVCIAEEVWDAVRCSEIVGGM